MDFRYTTQFADYRRSSFQNTSVQCKGEILWSVQHPAEAEYPQAVYLFGDMIVLVSRNGFGLFSPEGESLWHQEMIYDSPIGMTTSMVFYHDEHYRMSSVNVKHETKLKNGYYPGPINDDYPVLLFWTGKKDHLSVIQYTGGAEEHPPRVLVKRTVYNKRLTEWTYEIEGKQNLPPLYIEEVEQAVVFTDMILFINASNGTEISRREYPIEQPRLASAGPGGTVYLAGVDEGRPAVTAFGAEGDPLWKWSGDEGWPEPSVDQPPIVSEEGVLYLFMGRSIIALEGGEAAWSFGIDEGRFTYGTVFADGRLAAAAGNRLYGVDREGKQIFDIEFDDPIAAPPVGAGDGSIYLLTTKELLHVR